MRWRLLALLGCSTADLRNLLVLVWQSGEVVLVLVGVRRHLGLALVLQIRTALIGAVRSRKPFGTNAVVSPLGHRGRIGSPGVLDMASSPVRLKVGGVFLALGILKVFTHLIAFETMLKIVLGLLLPLLPIPMIVIVF